MSEYQKLLIDDYPMMIQPKLAALVGDRRALFLQQLHYLLGVAEKSGDRRKFRDGRWWNYNSYPNWQQDHFYFWSPNTLRRVIEWLEEKGLVISAHYGPPTDRRKWYTIDYDRLEACIQDPSLLNNKDEDDNDDPPAQNGQMDLPKMSRSGAPAQNEQVDLPKMSRSRSAQNGQTSLNKTPYLDSLINVAPGDIEDGEVLSENKQPEQERESYLSSEGKEHEGNIVEPEYIDTDEDGNEVEGGKKPFPKWKFPTRHELCQLAFEATGRKYFASRAERSQWLAIEKAIAPFDLGGRAKYPEPYVREKIEWAKGENLAYRRAKLTKTIAITFKSLISAIENEEMRDEWVSQAMRNPRKYRVDPHSGSHDDIWGDPRLTRHHGEEASPW